MIKIQGHWITAPIIRGCRQKYACSNCNCLMLSKTPYCPYCGLKMNRKYKENN